MNPLVSIIIATYRRDATLRNALYSLSNQSYSNFEVILVDDNDESEWNKTVETIAEEFKSKNVSVTLRYIANHPNQGSAKTRNIGIMASNGEYVTFLDDDDIYLPKKVENQVLFMKENNLDYSITDLDLYNEDDKLLEKRTRTYIQDTSKEKLFEYHMKHHITGTDAMMFRKDYIVQIGGFAPIDVGDEFYLMQRAIESGGKFGYLPESDIKAYVHTGEGGLSSGQGKIAGENALYAFKKQFFSQFSKKTVRYIKARHHAVLAYAYLRVRRFLPFIRESVAALMVSPAFCIKFFLGRKNQT